MSKEEASFTGEEAAIMKVIAEDSAAFYRKDFEAWSRHWVKAPYTRRLGWWTRGGVTDRTGWDAIAQRARQQMEEYPAANPSADQIRRENIVIRVGVDMAWVTFDQHAPATGEPDVDMPGLSRETRILEKHDGEWRIAYLGYIHQTNDQTFRPCCGSMRPATSAG